jgi:hypothetical protein
MLALGERRRLTLRAAARHRDPDRAIRGHANQIAARSGMTDEDQNRVQGAWFRVQGSRFRVLGSRFRVLGSRFRVLGSGFEVQRQLQHQWPPYTT